MHKIKVIIVDDSALIRALLKEVINQAHDMEVVGVAGDPYIARDLIREHNPDMITLDIEMPRMDGLEFLEKLMRLRPMPVLMVSTLTEQGSAATLRALELGAVDFIAKPKMDIKNKLEEYADEIREKIRMVAAAKVRFDKPASKISHQAKPKTVKVSDKIADSQESLIVIGASTGGTEAIKAILMQMPADSPPILIVQHMPPGFTKSYAARLDSLCEIGVREAVHGEPILPGHAYLAPGDYHLAITGSSAHYICQVTQDEPVNRHRPAVDVLFTSVANLTRGNAVGVILTGMGKDGAAGMKLMRAKGCKTIAQDEASCVVFGMPKEAIAQGGVDDIVPLDKIAQHLQACLGFVQA
jgi:two-component system, chemotaxis family, protein-glutamate methylesterase/glutaminase